MTNSEPWAQAGVPAVKVCAGDSSLTPPCGWEHRLHTQCPYDTACLLLQGSAASLYWRGLPTPAVPPAQSQRERPTEMLPCNYKDCPINSPASHPENRPPSQPAPKGPPRAIGPLNRSCLMYLPLRCPIRCYLTGRRGWCSRQMCYSISLRMC